MLLFHRTAVSEGRDIIRRGFEDEKWSFGTDDLTGAKLKVQGVWLTDKPLVDDGPPGAALLEVYVDMPESQLSKFEVHGVLAEARLFVVPADVVNPKANVRIGGVDARSSWFHEQMDDEDLDDEEDDEVEEPGA